jgi:hypothetical protein
MRWSEAARAGLLALFACAAIAGRADAEAFSEYGTPLGRSAQVRLPVFTGGASYAIDFFPEGVTIGASRATGLALVAHDRALFVQRNAGSSGFDPVATVNGARFAMDPSFVKLSPDGTRVALGLGFGQPLLVFPTSLLSAGSPPELIGHSEVQSYEVGYYDAAWMPDSRRLVVNGGAWPDQPFASAVGLLDTSMSGDTGRALVTGLPGASSGVAVDSQGNVLTGLGFAAEDTNRTGEIRIFSGSQIGGAVDYESGTLVAMNVLSAAFLSLDHDGNLVVGGGDVFGYFFGVPSSETELGYAALIERTAASGGGTVDEGDTSQFRRVGPSTCGNDHAVMAAAAPAAHAIAVLCSDRVTAFCTEADLACDAPRPGTSPTLHLYFSADAPDADGDGIPDASDNAYLTPNSGQQDADADGWANVADADFNDDGIVNLSDLAHFRNRFFTSDAETDMNSDGLVNLADLALFRRRFLTSEPWY